MAHCNEINMAATNNIKLSHCKLGIKGYFSDRKNKLFSPTTTRKSRPKPGFSRTKNQNL
jgi:hypothetical protein